MKNAQRVYIIFPALVIVFAGIAAYLVFSDRAEEGNIAPMDRSATKAELVVGTTTIQAELATNTITRTRGLSEHKSLATSTGMLFVFDGARRHGIWMKDMDFAIDILWLDAEGRIVDIAPNVSPDTYPTVFRPRTKASFVLELNAGAVQRHGITVGDQFDNAQFFRTPQ